MDKNNEYYRLIENLIKKHPKFPGYEAILDELIDDVYSHSEIIIGSINNEAVINSYLEKVISTSMITVPKRMNFKSSTKHRIITNSQSIQSVDVSNLQKVKQQDSQKVISEISDDDLYEQLEQSTDESKKDFQDDIIAESDDILLETAESPVQKAKPELVDKMINSINADEISNKNNYTCLDNETNNIEEYNVQIEEVEDLNEPESLDNAEDVEDLNEPESLDDAEDVEDLNEPESLDNDEEVEVLNEPEILDDDEEVEDLNEPEILDDAEDVEELNEPEILDDAEDVEELNEPEILDDAEEVEELNEPESLDGAEEVEDLNEPEILDDDEEVEELETFENIEETQDIEEFNNEELADDNNTGNIILTENENNNILSLQEAESLELDETSENNLEQINNETDIEFIKDNSEEVQEVEETNNVGLEFGFSEADSTLEINLDEDTADNMSDNFEENSMDFEPIDTDSFIDETSIQNDNFDILADDEDMLTENLEDESVNINDRNEINNIMDFGNTSKKTEEAAQDFKQIDYSVFASDSKNNMYDFVDPNYVYTKIQKLDNQKPNSNILKIFNLKYKQNLTIGEIASKLNIDKQIVISALNELIDMI